MNSEAGPETALTEFGFNQLESLVYCELLKHAPATGYRIAHLVGRAPANTYQALKALLQKGAVLVESDANEATSYVPVPPDQLFGSLRSRFESRADAALGTLRQVHQPASKEILSQLRTTSQVIERARSMLTDAKEMIVFDCMPEIYDVLKPDIDAARARGINVAGIAYRSADILPTMPFKGEPTKAVGKRWPGLGMILIVDACQEMIAQISRDMTQVLNAVYSDSNFLGCILHGLLATDIRLVALRSDPVYSELPPNPLDAFSLQVAQPAGLRSLLR